MPNPSPTQTPEFKQHQYQLKSEVRLSSRITSTKLPIVPINVEAIVDAMPNKAEFLREAVIYRLLSIGKLSPDQAEQLLKHSQAQSDLP